jgi:hypothetical protein
MAREGTSRPAAEPTTLHEICRRYVATATTLAKVLGVPLTEAFIQEHHQAIACCFIESGRAGVRLPASVALPPLGAAGAAAQGKSPAAEEPLKHTSSAAEPLDTDACVHIVWCVYKVGVCSTAL